MHDSTFLALGSPTLSLSHQEVQAHVAETLDRHFADRRNVLVVGPDATRLDSRAGMITEGINTHIGERLSRVLLALGTHEKMRPEKIQGMYGDIPLEKFHNHDWRNEVVSVGELSAEFIADVTNGAFSQPWPFQLNRMIPHGGHDLVISVGQVVPHEVVGMANFIKNLVVGCGGPESINLSHMIGAVFGMESIMGRYGTPLHRIFEEGFARFCADLPVLFILTVVGPARGDEPHADHGLVTRGLFIGTGPGCFRQACELSRTVNVHALGRSITKAVVRLHPEKYTTTWVGNKAIYRTRMAMADGGELIILAPGVDRFGEDPTIDALIRKYGYRPAKRILELVAQNADLQNNLSAAAHLIHGSPEGRFTVRYCVENLSEADIRGVGFEYGVLREYGERYPIERFTDGWNTHAGEEIFYVSNPGVGLWSRE